MQVPTRWWTVALLCALMLSGATLRVYQLSHQSYWMDEGYTVNAVMAIVDHGSSVLNSGHTYSCPLYCYPTASLAHALGENAFAYRLLSVIAGTVLILVLFFVGRAFFGTTTGLVTAGLVTFSYWQVAWSRQARWYTLFEVFFWLAVLCFYQTLYTKRYRLLWGAGSVVATLLAVYTHALGYLLPIIFIAWLVADWLGTKMRSWGDLLALLTLPIATVALLWVLLPGLFFGLLGMIHPHYVLPYYSSFYIRTYWPFLLLAIVATLRTANTKGVYLLLCIIFAYLLPLAFLTNVVEYRYLFQVTPALYLLAAVGALEVVALLRHRYEKVLLVVALLGLFFGLGFSVLVPRNFYLLEADDPATMPGRPYYAYTPQPNWSGAYAYIKTHQQDGDITISTQPQFNNIFLGQPGYWLAYDYLGFDTKRQEVAGEREFYVGADTLRDLADLQAITATHHGYLVLDTMAESGRLPDDTLAYIHSLPLAYDDQVNDYSHIWVYRF